jgi:hypothetical protein
MVPGRESLLLVEAPGLPSTESDTEVREMVLSGGTASILPPGNLIDIRRRIKSLVSFGNKNRKARSSKIAARAIPMGERSTLIASLMATTPPDVPIMHYVPYAWQ